MLEWVKGNVYTLVITLYPSNITLNSSAASYFKDVRWSMIGVDRETFQLAIKPVTKREVDLNLVPLEQLHKVSVGKGYARISNKAIIEEISLMIDAPIDGLKISATFDDEENMLIADLHELVKDKG
ncbi:hypothetical protein [[Eubacterium] hominis]|uniref:hypothetical protein n=1 Tax=[Eubacterium] hominis TaxID=2764325 RepID=UPI003A4D7C63